MEPFNFTALDFETMTAARTSACAIGLVRCENGVILQKVFSLVRPIPDDCEKTNTFVHGISPQQTAYAPTWAELYPLIARYIDGQTIVCHNADFDIDVFLRTSDYFGITPRPANVIDTAALTHASLEDACAILGITLENHHDPLEDATACARVMLKILGIDTTEHHYVKLNKQSKLQRTVASETLKPLCDDEIQNKETPFYCKKVVITGVFQQFPMREELASLLRQYGADINTSVSAKTNIVIVGQGCGPAKMQKIEKLNSEGHDIRIIREPELIDIINQFNMQ
jgi:DNA polymerase-3 subunit epsilon